MWNKTQLLRKCDLVYFIDTALGEPNHLGKAGAYTSDDLVSIPDAETLTLTLVYLLQYWFLKINVKILAAN